MNYCSIDDAWKNSENITDQFKLKKKTIENFSSEDNQEYNQTNTKKSQPDKINDTFDYNQFDYNYDIFNSSLFGQEHLTNTKPVVQEQINTTNTNNYHNVLICDDFLDHIETCKVCRMKMRNRFKSNLIEKIDNIIVDNKDIVLLFLLILFSLIFCNLVISIFK